VQKKKDTHTAGTGRGLGTVRPFVITKASGEANMRSPSLTKAPALTVGHENISGIVGSSKRLRKYIKHCTLEPLSF